MTKTTTAFVLLALCSSGLPGSAAPPRAEPMKVQVSVRDGSTTRSFNVVVGPDTACATASSKLPDQEFSLEACASHDARLTIEWSVHSSSGEYRSRSTISFEHGARAELGSSSGPQLTVAIQ